MNQICNLELNFLPDTFELLSAKCFIEYVSHIKTSCLDLTATMMSTMSTALLYIYNVFCIIATLLSKVLYLIVCFLKYFLYGILGLEDKSICAFSYLIVVIILFASQNDHCRLLLDRISLFVQQTVKRFSTSASERRELQAASLQAILENQRNEHREIEPINRQLEEQNIANENEENLIVEADRNRIEFQNRSNIQREYGTDLLRNMQENERNQEREVQNTISILENQRNQTQEQHRYYLRQRERIN